MRSPLGLKAMREPQEINWPHTASNPTIMFPVLNTAASRRFRDVEDRDPADGEPSRAGVDYRGGYLLPTCSAPSFLFCAGLGGVRGSINPLSAPVLASSPLSVLTGGMYAWLHQRRRPTWPVDDRSRRQRDHRTIIALFVGVAAWRAYVAERFVDGAKEGFGGSP